MRTGGGRTAKLCAEGPPPDGSSGPPSLTPAQPASAKLAVASDVFHLEIQRLRRTAPDVRRGVENARMAGRVVQCAMSIDSEKRSDRSISPNRCRLAAILGSAEWRLELALACESGSSWGWPRHRGA